MSFTLYGEGQIYKFVCLKLHLGLQVLRKHSLHECFYIERKCYSCAYCGCICTTQEVFTKAHTFEASHRTQKVYSCCCQRSICLDSCYLTNFFQKAYSLVRYRDCFSIMVQYLHQNTAMLMCRYWLLLICIAGILLSKGTHSIVSNKDRTSKREIEDKNLDKSEDDQGSRQVDSDTYQYVWFAKRNYGTCECGSDIYGVVS